MPTYEYQAMDATGMEIKNTIDADNEEEAQTAIRQMGYFVTKIVPADREFLLSPVPESHNIEFTVDLRYIYYGGCLLLGLIFGLVLGLAIAAS